MHAAPLAGVPLLHVHVAGLQTRFDSSVPGDFVSPLAPVPVPPPVVVPPLEPPPLEPPVPEPVPPPLVVVPPPLVPLPLVPVPVPLGGGAGSQHVSISAESQMTPSQKVFCASAIRLPDVHKLLISMSVMELQNALGLQHVAASACDVHGELWQNVVSAEFRRPFPRPRPWQKVSSDFGNIEEQGSLARQHLGLSTKAHASPWQEVVSLAAIKRPETPQILRT